MFIKVQHAGYLVENLDEAIDWYVNTFGAEHTGRGMGGPGELGFVQIGQVEVELIQPSDMSQLAGATHALHHVGYVVEDLDKAVEEFKAKGYKFATEEPISNFMGYRLIYFDTESTNGTRIHLTDARTMKS